MTIAREWDGDTYDRISRPMEQMGLAVLERLELRGAERVIDAGCGSGRITQALLERLPRGQVIGIDGAPSMIEAARARLGDRPNLRLEVGDLCELEPIPGGVDAIFSSATFHWIADHETLFARLRATLGEGGRLVAQCGGEGNIDVIHAAAAEVGNAEPFAPYFRDWQGPWHFAGPRETERLLAAAGFRAARCWLTDWPVTPDDPAVWLRTIILGAHLERLPHRLRSPYAAAVLDLLPRPVVVPYVRLNIDAAA